MSRKLALVIGNSEYEDKTLARLKAPEVDVRRFAQALRDPAIGCFDEVIELINQPEGVVSRAVCKFFAQKKPEDLLLLYFTGHGVLDAQGRLFLAVKDTHRDLLKATSLPATFLTEEMDASRSRRQVLVLDCCHSGAFARGTKGENPAITQATFEGDGFGRVVLTATDATQFAIEGDQVIQQAELSLFTHYLLEGLFTGQADTDQDGWISLDEWYDYAYEQVTLQTPNQTPRKWSYNQQGYLIIARNPQFEALRQPGLAQELLNSITDPRPWVRKGAVEELGRHLHGLPATAQAARQALELLARADDSREVSSAAQKTLDQALLATSTTVATTRQANAVHPFQPGQRAEPTSESAASVSQVWQKKLLAFPMFSKQSLLRLILVGGFLLSATLCLFIFLPSLLNNRSQNSPTSSTSTVKNTTKLTSVIPTVRVTDTLAAKVVDTITMTFAPAVPVDYIVQVGDSCWSIASKHKVSLDALLEQNNFGNTCPIAPGSKIIIPPNTGKPTEEPRRPVAPTAIGGGNGKISFIVYGEYSPTPSGDLIYEVSIDNFALRELGQSSIDIGNPRWQQGCGRIAFISSSDHFYTYAMNKDGSALTRLSEYSTEGGSPAWSSAWYGDWVAYIALIEGNNDILVTFADGSSSFNLTKNPASDVGPCWSPDAKQIAFLSDRDGNREIFLVNAFDSSEIKQLTFLNRSISLPVWSPLSDLDPANQKIAFFTEKDGRSQLNIIYPENLYFEQLTDMAGGYADEPVWSPNGEWIIFYAKGDDKGEVKQGLYVIRSNGKDLTWVGDGCCPVWSPDSKKIAFSIWPKDGRWYDLFMMNLDGSEKIQLSKDLINSMSPCWQP